MAVSLEQLAEKIGNALPFLRPVLTPGVLRFVRFGIVGCSGILINLGVYFLSLHLLFDGLTEEVTIPLLARTLPLRFMLSSLLGILFSVLNNFLINNAWTWADRSAQAGSFLGRMARYYLAASGGALVNHTTFVLLSSFLGTRLGVVWQLTGIVLGMMLNFIVNHFWTFRDRRKANTNTAN